jgi:hypothetical protein
VCNSSFDRNSRTAATVGATIRQNHKNLGSLLIPTPGLSCCSVISHQARGCSYAHTESKRFAFWAFYGAPPADSIRVLGRPGTTAAFAIRNRARSTPRHPRQFEIRSIFGATRRVSLWRIRRVKRSLNNDLDLILYSLCKQGYTMHTSDQ